MHLLFKQPGAERENDNCVGLKLAENTCIAPGAALHRVYDKAQVFNLHTGLEQHEGE